jgi:hypothetical protein
MLGQTLYTCKTKAMPIFDLSKQSERNEYAKSDAEKLAPSFKVSLNFESIDAQTPQDAVKTIVSWISGGGSGGGVNQMIFDVENEITGEKFTVDLSEDEEDQVLPNND